MVVEAACTDTTVLVFDVADETGVAELAGVVVLPEAPNPAFLQDPGEHL